MLGPCVEGPVLGFWERREWPCTPHCRGLLDALSVTVCLWHDDGTMNTYDGVVSYGCLMVARTVHLSDEEWSALGALADAEDRTRSYLVRQAVREFLRGRPVFTDSDGRTQTMTPAGVAKAVANAPLLDRPKRPPVPKVEGVTRGVQTCVCEAPEPTSYGVCKKCGGKR